MRKFADVDETLDPAEIDECSKRDKRTDSATTAIARSEARDEQGALLSTDLFHEWFARHDDAFARPIGVLRCFDDDHAHRLADQV